MNHNLNMPIFKFSLLVAQLGARLTVQADWMNHSGPSLRWHFNENN